MNPLISGTLVFLGYYYIVEGGASFDKGYLTVGVGLYSGLGTGCAGTILMKLEYGAYGKWREMSQIEVALDSE